MSKNKLNYTTAITKLEEIVKDIESGEIDVDTLTEKVRKASELIQFCRNKLKSTQEEVEKTFSDIEKDRKHEEG